MNRFHRYYALHGVLAARRTPVSRRELESKLECSRATVKRLVEDLRGYGVPIRYERDRNGYFLDRAQAYELPGIWFNASELYALLAAQQLLENAEPGLLAETLAPLKRKIARILAADHLGAGELPRRVRILRMGGRGRGRNFQRVAAALIERRRLRIEYAARTSGETTKRDVSPQRLIQALEGMFEHDRSAARGEMAARALIVFKHASELGNAHAHALFDRVRLKRNDGIEVPRILRGLRAYYR